MYKYEHGGNEIFKNKNIIDFSANINPLGLKENSLDILKNALDKSVFYPDNFSTNLRKAIGKYENINEDYIFCSNGASDIIFRIVNYIKPKKALILAPTFADYERALKTVNCKIYKHFLLQENDFNLKEDILEFIKKQQFDIIFLCNPNNPTGQLIENTLIEKILKISKGYVFVDECFIDFIKGNDKYTCKMLTNKYDKLIILKAFTKIFALAGFRLGYCITSNLKTINNLYFYGADWAVSIFSQEMGVYCLKDCKEYLEKSLAYINVEKNKIIESLKNLNFKIIGSNANYIFFKGYKGFDKILYNKYNICIRNCGNYTNLTDEYFRIGIYKKEQNKKLIEAIEQIEKGIK
ncbi:histidinol-phosphate transaminase [uncultured Tyzzerella sp.]|uniref:pyridoxal phosphate-dependent aminotransferase n=1 Tax=uncultured Tyzzerella sp. TaxID=2321398 RepID=UPI002943570C|nr:histidinol-phosphate transaminase [uncultured Tyzzerella sp.]